MRPPARRGDIDALVGAGPPGVVVLCDGVFQSAPAVSHAELARAIDAGWQVWGVSSLGAIRAHEMRREGMRGWGWVYAQFRRHADFTDDEMALLHLPEPSYLPLTEPLVNLRHALEVEGPALGITPVARRAAITDLRTVWFGERTLERMQEALVGPGGVEPRAARRVLSWMQRHRVKTLDLDSLMRQEPWHG